MAIVGNVLRHGSSTPADTPLLFSSGVGACDVYLSDNVALDVKGDAVALLGGALSNLREQSHAPVWPPDFMAAPAGTVIARLQREVGARPWQRDAIDSRIVRQAFEGSSTIIDSELDVGGYPQLEPTSAPFVAEAWDATCMVPVLRAHL
jgi:hypothetical protein